MTLEEAVERVEVVAQATLYFRPEVTEAMEAVAKVARVFPKMLEALEAARRELHCPHANDGAEMAPGTFQYGHRCVLCDESVDRNSEVRDALDSAIRAAREAVKP